MAAFFGLGRRRRRRIRTHREKLLRSAKKNALCRGGGGGRFDKVNVCIIPHKVINSEYILPNRLDKAIPDIVSHFDVS